MDLREIITRMFHVDATGFSDEALEAFMYGATNAAFFVNAMDKSRNKSWRHIENSMYAAFAILMATSSEVVDRQYEIMESEQDDSGK